MPRPKKYKTEKARREARTLAARDRRAREKSERLEAEAVDEAETALPVATKQVRCFLPPMIPPPGGEDEKSAIEAALDARAAAYRAQLVEAAKQMAGAKPGEVVAVPEPVAEAQAEWIEPAELQRAQAEAAEDRLNQMHMTPEEKQADRLAKMGLIERGAKLPEVKKPDETNGTQPCPRCQEVGPILAGIAALLLKGTRDE